MDDGEGCFCWALWGTSRCALLDGIGSFGLGVGIAFHGKNQWRRSRGSGCNQGVRYVWRHVCWASG